MDLSKCTIEIVKIGNDQVEKRWILYTKNVEPIIVKVEIYTQLKINNKISQIEAEKLVWQNMVISNKVAEKDDILNELADIKTELNKNIDK